MKPTKLLPFNQTIENKCILNVSKNKLSTIFVIFIFMVMCIEYLFNARVLMMTNNVEFKDREFYNLVGNNSKSNLGERNNKVVNILRNNTVLFAKGLHNAISSTKKKTLETIYHENTFIEDLMKQVTTRLEIYFS
jgi:hypothetical protein